MPGYNRTGPQGQGSMTGRRFGICRTAAEAEPSSYRHDDPGYRSGMGPARGNRCRVAGTEGVLGRQRGWSRTPAYIPYPEDPTNKIAVLKEQTDSIRQTLDGINSRIRDLEKASKEG